MAVNTEPVFFSIEKLVDTHKTYDPQVKEYVIPVAGCYTYWKKTESGEVYLDGGWHQKGDVIKDIHWLQRPTL